MLLMDRLAAKPATCLYGSIAALIVVVVCLKLVYIERWLLDNDNYITLSTFFLDTSDPEYIASARQFYDASVASCNSQDKRCIAYSGAIHGKQTYARPLIAFAGSFLAALKWLSSEAQFLAGITKATVFQVLVSTALVVALLLCFLVLLGRGRWPLLGVVAYLLPEHAAFSNVQLFLGVDFATAFIAVLVVMAASLCKWLAASPRRFFWDAIPLHRTVYALAAITIAILALRIVAARFPALYFGWPIPGAKVGAFVILLSVLGLLAFAGAIVIAARRAKAPAGIAWVTVVLLFGFVATGESFFTTSFHIAPRGHIFLIAVPLMVYLSLRPNGRAIWLLPLLGFFHVAIVGLLCGCIIAIETVSCARRRSFSLALAVSIAVLAVAIAHTVLTAGNFVMSTDSGALSQMLSKISLVQFLPGAVVVSLLACAAYVAWRLPDPAGDLLLRATVLALLLAGAGQLRVVLDAAGYDLMDPVAYNFVLLWYYLAPIVCGAGAVLVLLGFAMSVPAFQAHGFTFDTKTLSLLCIGVVALMAARGANTVGQPPNPFVAIARGAYLIATQSSPPVDPMVREAAAPTDRYLVGPHPGDTITMMSILKMKARSAAGLLDRNAVRVDVIKR